MRSLFPVFVVIGLALSYGKPLNGTTLKLIKIPLRRTQNEITPVERPNESLLEMERLDRIDSAGIFEIRLQDDKKWQRFRDYKNVEYVGSVSIGNPPQEFSVVLDTGSADFWVPSVDCYVRCHEFCRVEAFGKYFCASPCRVNANETMPATAFTCSNKATYNETQSDTFEDANGYFVIQYGTGSARGKLGFDDVWLGDPSTPDQSLQIKKVSFGRANSMAKFFENTELDGILGLGFRSYSVADSDPPFVKAYKDKLVDPIFTVWMKMTETFGADGGQITYGGVDEDHCDSTTPDRVDVKLSQAGYWQFKIEKVKIAADGGKPYTLANVERFDAISDTGTSYAIIPNPLFDELAAISHSTVYGGTIRVDCDAKFEIVFTVKDVNGKERDISMTEKHLVLPNKNNKECVVAVSKQNKDPVAVIGTPLMRAYCNIHDMEKKVISFTTIKNAT
uniref:Peptidase A1 domain-containing protein n=1 Tax=Bursaphelenchus xylophilus TaxID=6326 RepID=A0A1I7S4D7_BURXY